MADCMKRIWLLFLLMTLLGGVASADWSTDLLPGCYRTLGEGRAVIFSDAEVPVYTMDSDGAFNVSGNLAPWTGVTVLYPDAGTGYAQVQLDGGGAGYVASRHLFMTTDITRQMVVKTDVPGNRLNLRQTARKDGTVLGKYYAGTIVERLDEGENGYVHVRIGDMTGYMAREYLDVNIVTPTAEIPVTEIMGETGNGAFLLAMPVGTAERVGTVYAGEMIYVLGVRGDGFYHVMAEGQIGYLSSQIVRDVFEYQLSKTSNPVVPQNAAGNFTPDGNWSGSVSDGGSPYYSASSQTGNVTAWGTQTKRTGIWPFDVSGGMAAVNNSNPMDRLNLRAEASTSAVSLGKYYNGVLVHVIQSNGDWTSVSIGALSGYMKTQYLLFDWDRESWPASAMPVLVVNHPSGYLNLRAQPSMISEVYGKYPNGSEVTLMGFTNEWAHVILDGNMGFMLTQYLQE